MCVGWGGVGGEKDKERVLLEGTEKKDTAI